MRCLGHVRVLYDVRVQRSGAGVRPDKQKVVDEAWDADRIRAFLDSPPLAPGADPDFSALLHAYRGMRPNDFRSFLALFQRAGRNLDARDDAGRTLLEVIAGHRLAAPFRKALLAAGAKSRPPAAETRP